MNFMCIFIAIVYQFDVIKSNLLMILSTFKKTDKQKHEGINFP